MCTTICGDSIIAGEEECDDGNLIDGDYCTSVCQIDKNSDEYKAL